MKDEGRSVIRLLNSSLQNTVTFYHFQIIHNSQLYSLDCRYSKLRSIAALLPQTKAKFPEPCHVSMAVSALIGNKTLLDDRFQKLTKYFEQISQIPQLSENKGFKRLLEESQIMEQSHEKKQPPVPITPRICGRKICCREWVGQLLIVIG